MTNPTQFNPSQLMCIGIMSATTMMIASVVRILEEKGIVAPDAFANALEEAAAKGEAEKHPLIPDNFQRHDLTMLRTTARLLRQNEGRGWKPIVIQGGYLMKMLPNDCGQTPALRALSSRV